MNRLSDLIAALTILDKYSDPDNPLCWSIYDESICVIPIVAAYDSPVSKSDAEKLGELGWFIHEERDCWAIWP